MAWRARDGGLEMAAKPGQGDGGGGRHDERGPAAPEGGPETLGRHLVGLSTALRLQMGAGLIARGHDLRPSTAQVIPNLPESGLRMSELATRLRLTLQRTGQLVGELEALGYLAREPDPDDGRARRVVFAPRGRALVRDIEAITAEITGRFEAAIGRERFGELCRLLAELDVAVNGDDAPVRVLPADPGRAQDLDAS